MKSHKNWRERVREKRDRIEGKKKLEEEQRGRDIT